VSGYDEIEDKEDTYGSGGDDFLAKPFDPAELLARVKLLLRQRQRQAAQIQALARARRQGEQQMPYVGDRIGEYVIADTLGWGKSAVVFKVSDPRSGEIRAIKMLTRHAAQFPDVVTRFRNEARLMNSIRHPNVLALHHAGEFNHCPYLVLEYFPGIDLEEYVVTRGRPSLERFRQLVWDLAEALHAIHQAGVVHRDVKLKNILIVPLTSRIKISDFGIALAEDSPHVTQDGYLVGTPLYMAPELFTGDPATVRSDIYAYGATLYHLLAGMPPFIAEQATALYRQHRDLAPAPLVRHREEVPSAWDDLIVGRCLAKDPAQRPADLAEVLAAIARIH